MSTTIKHVEAAIPPSESFVPRHVGPDEYDVAEMLKTLGFQSLDALMDATIPPKIRFRDGLDMPRGMTELELLTYLRSMAAKNQVFRSFIGMGYSDCVTPPVIQRNIIENPGWYTAYTPDQAELAQGRLEALLNFQTLVLDLTGLECANASLWRLIRRVESRKTLERAKKSSTLEPATTPPAASCMRRISASWREMSRYTSATPIT